ncbi:hypothetical protein GGS20DRAFT_582339 [Poronia punctata]|nr:hypothetical protein GGS20DRAFT_582339 [Poronia punctata]
MSGGGGGFYRFRCKYFYTHDCPNWVYVNHTACAHCTASGRESDQAPSQADVTRCTREIYVPRVEAGALYYTLMEIEPEPTDTAGNHKPVAYATLKQTQPAVPTTTSALPGPPTTTTSF